MLPQIRILANMNDRRGTGAMQNLIKTGLMSFVLSLSLTASVAAGPVEDGQAAYRRGDYATALRLWRPLADQGETPSAQFNLGSMYATGRGVKRDNTVAVEWWRQGRRPGQRPGTVHPRKLRRRLRGHRGQPAARDRPGAGADRARGRVLRAAQASTRTWTSTAGSSTRHCSSRRRCSPCCSRSAAPRAGSRSGTRGVQDKEQKIARPKQIYTGQRELDFVPASERWA